MDTQKTDTDVRYGAVPLLKDLRASQRDPVTVKAGSAISEALTLMMVNDYSQLPVMGGGKVPGYISWRTVGEAFALGKQVARVRDCMQDGVTVRDENTPLIDAVRDIVSEDFILVSRKERSVEKIIGLVTASDITEQFVRLAEPFFLLGRIETALRQLVQSVPEGDSADLPHGGRQREVSCVEDLTLGQLISQLDTNQEWVKLENSQLDRARLVAFLGDVCKLRNHVAHFRPGVMQLGDIDKLRCAARLLELIAKSRASMSQELTPPNHSAS